MTVYGQRQQLGIPTPELSTVARNDHRDYLEIILRPRVAMASRGCTEADAALTAFIEYARWRQVAGLGEDPEFVPCGVDWIVPQRRADLYVRLCFREAHAFCVRTGDFPGFIGHIASMFVRAEYMLGAEISQEHLISPTGT